METEGGKIVRAKQIFKAFSDKTVYLIFPEHPTFHRQDDVQGTNLYQSLKKV